MVEAKAEQEMIMAEAQAEQEKLLAEARAEQMVRQYQLMAEIDTSK